MYITFMVDSGCNKKNHLLGLVYQMLGQAHLCFKIKNSHHLVKIQHTVNSQYLLSYAVYFTWCTVILASLYKWFTAVLFLHTCRVLWYGGVDVKESHTSAVPTGQGRTNTRRQSWWLWRRSQVLLIARTLLTLVNSFIERFCFICLYLHKMFSSNMRY